ncbi:2Fe-2S iron-sulfur cluster-binding protein [Myxococcus sp. MxC21-1]|uniref:2Fe-2S iron-sulfur cluster-binding protein n=1 Tax=Myxococcus sp. MxC21-1 TaxID=3041439 RepID=UPI002931ED7B|nr:2Fe-2S iron-sulfur cluster-binding protein [Myxococcus sp. MxC21-1]WNZ60772.1 2Fe-2S iron-sulfur cluster-binding protein [Myxococcus sp. MxC21-1]
MAHHWRACVVPAATLRAPAGTPHPLPNAFVAEQAGQCAYCIPGMVVTAAALLKEKPPRVPLRLRWPMPSSTLRGPGCGSCR